MEYTWNIFGLQLDFENVLIISFISAALFLILAYICFAKQKSYKELYWKTHNGWFLATMLCLTLGFATSALPCLFWDYEKNYTKEYIHNAVSQNYTLFINGEKKEVETINIDSYSDIVVDDKNKYIVITVD